MRLVFSHISIPLPSLDILHLNLSFMPHIHIFSHSFIFFLCYVCCLLVCVCGNPTHFHVVHNYRIFHTEALLFPYPLSPSLHLILSPFLGSNAVSLLLCHRCSKCVSSCYLSCTKSASQEILLSSRLSPSLSTWLSLSHSLPIPLFFSSSLK